MTKLKKFGFFDDTTNPKLELMELRRDVPHIMEHNILNYLKGGYEFLLIMGIVEDFLDPQKTIIGPPNLLTDGTWVWTSDVMYYVEKYHIQLPGDFLTHMEQNNWQCPQVNTSDLELEDVVCFD